MRLLLQFSAQGFTSSSLMGISPGFLSLRMRRADITRMAVIQTAVMLMVVMIVMLVLSASFGSVIGSCVLGSTSLLWPELIILTEKLIFIYLFYSCLYSMNWFTNIFDSMRPKNEFFNFIFSLLDSI